MQSPINYSIESVAKVGPEPTPASRLQRLWRSHCGQVGHPSEGGDFKKLKDKSLCSPPWRGTRSGGWARRRQKNIFASSSIFIIILALISRIASGAGLAAAERYGEARSEADEKIVWDVWKAHLSSSNNQEAVMAAFQKGEKTAPNNSLLIVARGLCSWHLLKSAKTNEAVQLLETMLAVDHRPSSLRSQGLYSGGVGSTVDSLNAAGSEMGRRWLTRIDRENVRNALGCYYCQQIAYPPNLKPLKKMPTISPLSDRWNIPWIYQLTGFKTIKGLDDQRYLLQSAQLKETSDLKTALAQPYAGTIKIKPVALAPTASGIPNVRFESADQKAAVIVLSEGAKFDNVSLVYVGDKIIILSDGDYWLIAPKPRQ